VAYLIKLPSVAADASGGVLHQWLKQEGDRVAVGDALAEIETEKAIVEINAEQAGVLGRIVVQAGPATVPINTVIGVLVADGEGAEAIDRALAEQGGAAVAASAAGAPASAAPAVAAPAGGRSPDRAPAPAVAQQPAGASSPAASSAKAASAPIPGGRLFASPLARRLAAQWHVDLLGVTGTGPHGRIVRRDVEAARDRAPAVALPA